jgi:tetratricopeptide (TPR) repeat protein
VAYYHNHENSNNLEKRKHMLWFIANHPDWEFVTFSEYLIFPPFDKEGYETLKKEWLVQVDKHPRNPNVIGNAAAFLDLQDSDLSIEFYKKASALDPENYKWPTRLAGIYSSRVTDESGIVHQRDATLSLKYYEEALDKDPKESIVDAALRSLAGVESEKEFHRYYLLPDVAKEALEVGDLQKAERYSKELLDLSSKRRPNDNGDGIFWGNTILGRVSLRKGDIEAAKRYLIESGKTTGSPVLHSFGPSMILAKELLDKGERNTVIEFFHLCAKFWALRRTSLDDWENAVREGETPDFGHSLKY